jgi:hypothetical protein
MPSITYHHLTKTKVWNKNVEEQDAGASLLLCIGVRKMYDAVYLSRMSVGFVRYVARLVT